MNKLKEPSHQMARNPDQSQNLDIKILLYNHQSTNIISGVIVEP